jgi:glycogenin glucosyltransferase
VQYSSRINAPYFFLPVYLTLLFSPVGRPDLHAVLTKLHIFRLVQYKKVIFLDADVLPIRPLSHLFHITHPFSAVPDVGWPDIFNSGVLVISPGDDKFDEVRKILGTRGSWDGGDQGVLNEWRGGDWNRLSFTYNTTPTAAYTCVIIPL